MPYEPKDNSLTLFPNKYFKEGGKVPLMKGSGKIGGVEYEAAAWKFTSDKGSRLFISFTPKAEADAERAAYKAQQGGQQSASQSDFPF